MTTSIRTAAVPVQRMLWLGLLILLPWNLDAYRLGDAIDTEILTPKDSSSQHAPKRKQMPIFGVDSSTQFGPMTDSRFSIHFEEGFRALPWVDLKNFMGAPLEKLEVTFVFSRSGGGEIHSLASRTFYSKDRKAAPPENGEITVEYKWIEEQAVDLNGGAFVMFLAIFITSLFFLVDLCGLCDNGEDSLDPYTVPNASNSHGNYSDHQVDPMASMSGSRIPKYE